MKRKEWATVALCALGLFAAAAADAACPESCLNRTLDTYLAALVKHDASRLPVSPQLVAIENSRVTKPGEGLWQDVKGLPVVGYRFVDAQTGQIAYFGATELNDGKIGSMFVRLKVDGGRITESELFTRGAYTGEGQETRGLLEPDILYVAEVPKARRSTRTQLHDIVNSYMEGISQHNGKIVPASERCDRYQAGRKFTNSYAVPVDRGGGTCQTSMDHLTGQVVVNRRFPIIDERLGIAVGLFIIPHGERTPPNSTNVAEVFKIVDGKIRSIEEFSYGGVFPPTSGFPDEAAAGK